MDRRWGNTPLHHACSVGNETIVEFLIDQEREKMSKGVGGDPAYRSYNMKNRRGMSAVFCARSTRVVEMFLDLNDLEVSCLEFGVSFFY